MSNHVSKTNKCNLSLVSQKYFNPFFWIAINLERPNYTEYFSQKEHPSTQNRCTNGAFFRLKIFLPMTCKYECNNRVFSLTFALQILKKITRILKNFISGNDCTLSTSNVNFLPYEPVLTEIFHRALH